MTIREIEFVSAIYDAVLDPRGLSIFTDLLMESLNGSSAVMHMIAGKKAFATVSSNIPERVVRLYCDYYHKVNPLLPVGMERFQDGETALLSDLMPIETYFNCEFFTDFARPTGTVHLVGGVIGLDASHRALPAIHRPLDDRAFTESDCAKLQSFLKPAGGALRLRSYLWPALGAGLAALEAVAFGAIICDGLGRLAFANQAAERLAAKGSINLGSRAGGISASLPEEHCRLAQLVRNAAQSARAGAMAVTGAAGEKLFLLVTPLPRLFGEAAQLVLVTMRAADRSPLADAATLASIFGLTPAEARVAAALSSGAEMGETAAKLGVKEATVRTHIKHLLAKSGAANQREFVALLGLLPPVKIA